VADREGDVGPVDLVDVLIDRDGRLERAVVADRSVDFGRIVEARVRENVMDDAEGEGPVPALPGVLECEVDLGEVVRCLAVAAVVVGVVRLHVAPDVE